MTEKKSKEKKDKEKDINSKSEFPWGRFEKQKSRKYGSVVWALILITLGSALLLNNFGLLPWGIWKSIWRLWPLLVIFWGIEVFFRKSWLSSTLISLIFLIIFVYIFSLLILPPTNPINQWIERNLPDLQTQTKSFIKSPEAKTKNITISEDDYKQVDERKVEINIGSAKLDLTDNTSSDYFSLDARYFEGIGEPKVESKLRGKTLEIDFFTTTNRKLYTVPHSERVYDIVLGKAEIPSDIDINLGSGSANLDLTRVALETVSLDIGSGSFEISLDINSIPRNTINIDVGSGSVDINLPEEIGLKAEYSIGSGSIKINSSTLKGDGVFTSENFDSSSIILDLDIDLGSGSVKIRNR